jgi:hypothetical protein
VFNRPSAASQLNAALQLSSDRPRQIFCDIGGAWLQAWSGQQDSNLRQLIDFAQGDSDNLIEIASCPGQSRVMVLKPGNVCTGPSRSRRFN